MLNVAAEWQYRKWGVIHELLTGDQVIDYVDILISVGLLQISLTSNFESTSQISSHGVRLCQGCSVHFKNWYLLEWHFCGGKNHNGSR